MSIAGKAIRTAGIVALAPNIDTRTKNTTTTPTTKNTNATNHSHMSFTFANTSWPAGWGEYSVGPSPLGLAQVENLRYARQL